MASQKPRDSFRKRPDVAIDNDGGSRKKVRRTESEFRLDQHANVRV